MTNDPSRPSDLKAPSDLKTLWQGQPPEPRPVDFNAIRKEAQRFQRRFRFAEIREYVAALVVIVGFGFYLRFLPGLLIKIGSALAILWAVFYMWQWRRLLGARPLPEEAAACLDFHRRELARRRDAIRGAWRWALAPIIPVFLLFLAQELIGLVNVHAPWSKWLIIILTNVAMAESLVLMWLWTLYRADKLQDRIDELDALGRSAP